jgi:hypothetical protein
MCKDIRSGNVRAAVSRAAAKSAWLLCWCTHCAAGLFGMSSACAARVSLSCSDCIIFFLLTSSHASCVHSYGQSRCDVSLSGRPSSAFQRPSDIPLTAICFIKENKTCLWQQVSKSQKHNPISSVAFHSRLCPVRRPCGLLVLCICTMSKQSAISSLALVRSTPGRDG